MSGASELDELHSLISSVRRCITALQSQYGDIAQMRRIVNDADRLLNDTDRLDIDADELDSGRAAPQLHAGKKIPVPDTQYDTDFWRGVDDDVVLAAHPSLTPHELESVRTCQQVTALRRTDHRAGDCSSWSRQQGRCRHASGLAHRVLRVPENRCRA